VREDLIRRPTATFDVNRLASALAAALLLLHLGAPSLPADHFADPASAVEGGRQALRDSGSYPWYDRANDDLRPLDVEPPKPQKSQSPPSGSNSGVGATGATLTMWLGWFLLAVVILGVVAIMIYILLARETGSAAGATVVSGHTAASTVDRIEALPFEVKRPQSDLLGEAQRHFTEGSYGEAIIYYYSLLLIELDKAQVIRLAQGKTNRQYVREARQAPPLDAILSQAMVAFEDVFFGHHTLSRARCEACFGRLEEFRALVHQRLKEEAA